MDGGFTVGVIDGSDDRDGAGVPIDQQYQGNQRATGGLHAEHLTALAGTALTQLGGLGCGLALGVCALLAMPFTWKAFGRGTTRVDTSPR